MVRIGLIQMHYEKGAIAENLESMSRYLAEAADRGVEVVGFPEMNITGYADATKYPEAILRLNGAEVAQVLEMTRRLPVTVLAGLIEGNAKGKSYITQIVVRDGQLLGYYRKRTIEDEKEE